MLPAIVLCSALTPGPSPPVVARFPPRHAADRRSHPWRSESFAREWETLVPTVARSGDRATTGALAPARVPLAKNGKVRCHWLCQCGVRVDLPFFCGRVEAAMAHRRAIQRVAKVASRIENQQSVSTSRKLPPKHWPSQWHTFRVIPRTQCLTIDKSWR